MPFPDLIVKLIAIKYIFMFTVKLIAIECSFYVHSQFDCERIQFLHMQSSQLYQRHYFNWHKYSFLKNSQVNYWKFVLTENPVNWTGFTSHSDSIFYSISFPFPVTTSACAFLTDVAHILDLHFPSLLEVGIEGSV